MSIRWDCEKKGCYKDNCIPDWGFLRGLFPRGCKPTDIDGLVEIDGRVLVLEWKSVGVPLNSAQKMVFVNLTKLSPMIKVLILYGDVKELKIEYAQWVFNGKVFEMKKTSTEAIQRVCKRWGDGQI